MARYTCAAGITPSGTVHIGNFREIITVDLVVRALRDALGDRGAVRFLYSWDDYDVFRRVPDNLPNGDDYTRYLRMPIGHVPDPYGEASSFARMNELRLERLLPIVGIDPDYRYQAARYESSEYAAEIRRALERRATIRDILNGQRTTPLAEDWWPITIFSRFNKKDDTTILSWDGEWEIRYRCNATGNEEGIDLRTSGVTKLRWRIDWPMRWAYERVDFEPAGKDHHTKGGSFDTARQIVKAVYDTEAPISFQYDFIGIKGGSGKMSSSSGEVIGLDKVLDIYQPEIVRWLFAAIQPNAEFTISFDGDVNKIYEDYDRGERIYFGLEQVSPKRTEHARRIYELAQVGDVPERCPFQIPFRHMCTLIQITQGNVAQAVVRAMEMGRVAQALERMLGHPESRPPVSEPPVSQPSVSQPPTTYDRESQRRLEQRARCAWEWVNKYAPEEFRFLLRPIDAPLPPCSAAIRNAIAALNRELSLRFDEYNERDIKNLIYDAARNADVEPADLFTALYLVLIAKPKGPRLPGLIRAIGRNHIVNVLREVIQCSTTSK